MSAKSVAKRIKRDVRGLRPGHHWLTTVAGVMAAAGPAAVFMPPPYNAYAAVIGAMGATLLGTAAPMANKTSAEMEAKEEPKP